MPTTRRHFLSTVSAASAASLLRPTFSSAAAPTADPLEQAAAKPVLNLAGLAAPVIIDSIELLHKGDGEHGAIFGVAFSTSGKLVAACGFDGQLRLFDADTGKLIKELVPVPVTGKASTAQK